MAAELLVLRLVHILGGLFWVGAGLFSSFFLGPALKAAGPAAAGAIMGNMQRRHMFQVMPTVAILTILSGARLMWIASAGDPHWFTHRPGHTYAISGSLAIIAFLLSLLVARPAMVRAGKLAQGASDGSQEQMAAEMARLQKRAGLSSNVAVTFLILATAGMAIARYM